MKLRQLKEERYQHMFATDKQEILDILRSLRIKTDGVHINDDGIVDVDYSVYLSEVYFPNNTLPIRFGSIKGSFIINKPNLLTLEGCPHTVVGDFDCSDTNITSLVGGPQTVGTYECSGTNITSLEGVAEYIDQYLYAGRNINLTSLHNIHKQIKHCKGISLDETPIKSHVLGLFLIDGFFDLMAFDLSTKQNQQVSMIVGKHLNINKDIHACQEELIEAGLSEYAKL